MSAPAVRLLPGDYAPWFHAAALDGSERFAFNTVAGRAVVLLFLGSAGIPAVAEALALVARNRSAFDDANACIFGVTTDPEDVAKGRIAVQIPGIRHFLDYDKEVSRLYGAALDERHYQPHWLVLDRELRVTGRFDLQEGEQALACMRATIARAGRDSWAPVIVVPNVFPPELCRQLIDLYAQNGGKPSGFMRDIDGKTRLVLDQGFKRRQDYMIEDEVLIRRLMAHVHRRVAPAIERAFQFKATRIERYLVACYEAGNGHFQAHRDNTTFGTRHRRFAVTINLNADEYEGGDLRFPEFGPRTYRAPTGGAVAFSCSLLHEALPVTRGTRYAFLPFLYDDAAAEIRRANLSRLAAEDAAAARNAGS